MNSCKFAVLALNVQVPIESINRDSCLQYTVLADIKNRTIQFKKRKTNKRIELQS